MGLFRATGRPLFFALPPEAAHRLAGFLLRAPLPWRAIGGVHDDPALATELAGIPLRNPIGLAAGFDKSCRFAPALGSLGFGYVVAGTVTRAPRTGNPKPRIARRTRTRSIVNAMGLPNRGAAYAAGRLSRSKRTSPVLVSLAAEAVADVAANLELLEPLVDGFELNVSSPSLAWAGPREREDHLRTLLAELAPRKRRPLFVKLPPFEADAERDAVLALAAIARDGGADGLTCSNTRLVPEPRLSTGSGGLSGRELFEGTVRIVEEVRRATGGALPINACGGVFTAEDALACLEAGATTVQVYTGFIYEGPRIVKRIAEGLSEALRARGASLASLRPAPA